MKAIKNARLYSVCMISILNEEGMNGQKKSRISLNPLKISLISITFFQFFRSFFLSQAEAAPEAVKRKAEEVVEADESATDETAAVPEKKTKVDETTNGAEAEIVA